MRECLEFGIDFVDYDTDPENYLAQIIGEIEHDEFKNSNRKIDSFKEDLHIYEKNLQDSFYFAILYGVRYKLTGFINF